MSSPAPKATIRSNAKIQQLLWIDICFGCYCDLERVEFTIVASLQMNLSLRLPTMLRSRYWYTAQARDTRPGPGTKTTGRRAAGSENAYR